MCHAMDNGERTVLTDHRWWLLSLPTCPGPRTLAEDLMQSRAVLTVWRELEVHAKIVPPVDLLPVRGCYRRLVQTIIRLQALAELGLLRSQSQTYVDFVLTFSKWPCDSSSANRSAGARQTPAKQQCSSAWLSGIDRGSDCGECDGPARQQSGPETRQYQYRW